MNQYHPNVSDRCFILHKLSQLIKRPRRVLTTLLLVAKPMDFRFGKGSGAKSNLANIVASLVKPFHRFQQRMEIVQGLALILS
ncbi:hypothetical protein PcaKH15_32430 [Parageobacillus caldoxylosilyticus]|jgi:hypothetical protein|uniref:Uncharacterized protein n=1 Tax=Parageobacillus caldoxylosilyticus NBRC 107762 TaxID=1220594 RepID=A0A023DEX1_9BACL|nr:hypothetical protein PcaKH15_32430 [Parageobacillus caldoxylosilyticus]BDG41128.1 hypothetical protein PcaKH16_32670 [Parageobacillus caldoxylosilyticus]BDG44882.1 hypothetical protein PcaKH35_32270 [Parageobacillus caldoxylosilyticus]GAJ39778.1 hypothetical protein GCA01S_026_00240 [Parageobacillus caldoxylosilyticus NBRC 107762]